MLKKVLGFLGAALLGVIVVVAAVLMILVKQGWQFDTVLSGSMVPVFRVGGLAIFEPATAQDVKVGDIITFQYPSMNTPICHRIISIDDSKGSLIIHTKGDANNAPDPQAVTADMVKGKNVGYIPYGGYAIDVSNAGKKPVRLGDRSYPLAVVLVFIMGMGFIALTLREAFEPVLFPQKMRRKELLKKHAALTLKRRKQFGRA